MAGRLPVVLALSVEFHSLLSCSIGPAAVNGEFASVRAYGIAMQSCNYAPCSEAAQMNAQSRVWGWKLGIRDGESGTASSGMGWLDSAFSCSQGDPRRPLSSFTQSPYGLGKGCQSFVPPCT